MSTLPIFDGHNDTLTRLDEQDRSFFTQSRRGQLDLPRARAGGLMGGFFAIFTPPPKNSPERNEAYGAVLTEHGYTVTPRSPIDPDYARLYTDSMIDLLHQLIEESEGEIGLVRSWDDLEWNLNNEVFSIVLHIEGAEAIRPDLSNLETYYERGLRSLGPVWSRPNVFGSGVPFRFPSSPAIGPGLTDAGKLLVRECNRLRIMIDLAHINEQGFWDVARLSDAPLVVTHAGVHSICPSTRNLTDAQIDAIGESNGVIGIIFEPTNTRPDGKPVPDTPTPLSVIVEHITYVVERIGIDHVAFGSDFDGAAMPEELPDAAHLPRLIQALRDAGYDQVSLEKIAYQNWFRVLRET